MNNRVVAGLIAALALFSFFVFPGHTYLTQDTQIYIPILEHLWDATALQNDLLVRQSHAAFTLYDEYAIGLRWLTHSSFSAVLQTTQLVCRAAGIWGMYLLALAILRKPWRALSVAAVCALGAEVWGPAVLVVEFEPSPRAFAIPLLLLALGLAAHARWRWSGVVAAAGFLLHPTSVAPFWLCLFWARQWRVGFLSLAAALGLLLFSASFQPGMEERHLLLARIAPPLEAIQRMRAAYNWVGMWFLAEWPKYLACVISGGAAFLRLRPVIPARLRPLLLLLPCSGLLCLPLSYVLLDRWKWSVMPQVQPARLLLFTVVISIFLTAAAALSARRAWEASLWLALAITPAIAAPRPRHIPTPALSSLSKWAAANTPKDSVFLFPRAGKSLEPGLFRAEALRAVYVDWKGGGQANFLPEFGLEWWHRYQDVMQKSHPLAYYRSLGIDYLVLPGQPYQVIPVPSR